jgi:hypothetical protein
VGGLTLCILTLTLNARTLQMVQNTLNVADSSAQQSIVNALASVSFRASVASNQATPTAHPTVGCDSDNMTVQVAVVGREPVRLPGHPHHTHNPLALPPILGTQRYHNASGKRKACFIRLWFKWRMH